MTFSIRDLTERLQRRWTDLVLLGLAGLAVAGLASMVTPNRYRASAVVLVGTAESYDLYLINEQTALLEGIAYSDEVWTQTAQDLARGGWISGPDDVGSVLQHISLAHPMRGEWTFRVEDRDPTRAAEIANTWSRSFIAAVTRAVEAESIRALNRERRLGLDEELVTQVRRCSQLAAAVEQVGLIEANLIGLPSEAPGDSAQAAALQSLAAWLVQSPAVLPRLDDRSSVLEQRALAASLASLLEMEQTTCRESAREIAALRSAAFESDAAYADAVRGLLPDLAITLLQESRPPDRPTVPLASYLLVGALVGLGAGLIQMLWFVGRRER